MKDGSRLHGDILSMDSLNIILRHPQLGQISLPLKNITRVGIPESRPAIPFHSLIDPAMKQAMTLFLCACALPTALLLPHARAEGSLRLNPGKTAGQHGYDEPPLPKGPFQHSFQTRGCPYGGA